MTTPNNINKCPYCKSTGNIYCIAHDRLQKYVDGDFQYFICPNCNALYQVPMPDTQQALSFYPSSNYRPFIQTSLNRENWDILGIIAEEGKLLDIGCGGGASIQSFLNKKPKWHATGIDQSSDTLTFAQKLLPPDVRLLHGSLQQVLPNLKDADFDIIILQDVIEHVNDPAFLFAQMARLLKQKGLIYLTFPNSQSLTMNLFKNFAYHLEAPRHLTIPSIDSISLLTKNNKLKFHILLGQSGGAMFWKSLPWSYAKAGWAYKLRLVQIGEMIIKPLTRKPRYAFSMIKTILKHDV